MTETGFGESKMKPFSVKTIAASARSHTHNPDQSPRLGHRDHGRQEDSNGHFITSPWEGLNWEPGAQEKSQAESELLDGIEKFLKSRSYGE
jgi:hypothetical protein